MSPCANCLPCWKTTQVRWFNTSPARCAQQSTCEPVLAAGQQCRPNLKDRNPCGVVSLEKPFSASPTAHRGGFSKGSPHAQAGLSMFCLGGSGNSNMDDDIDVLKYGMPSHSSPPRLPAIQCELSGKEWKERRRKHIHCTCVWTAPSPLAGGWGGDSLLVIITIWHIEELLSSNFYMGTRTRREENKIGDATVMWYLWKCIFIFTVSIYDGSHAYVLGCWTDWRTSTLC